MCTGCYMNMKHQKYAVYKTSDAYMEHPMYAYTELSFYQYHVHLIVYLNWLVKAVPIRPFPGVLRAAVPKSPIIVAAVP